MTLFVVALSLFCLNLDLEFYISERVGGSSMMMPATLLTDALVMVIMVIIIVTNSLMSWPFHRMIDTWGIEV